LNEILGIIQILGKKLYSIKYDDGYESEFDRLMELWNDAEYVYEYFEANQQALLTEYWAKNNWRMVRDSIPDQAYNFEDLILQIAESEDPNVTLDEFFEPLDNFDPNIEVYQLSKGRNREKPKCLRIYAIKVGSGKYVITGGAIKLTRYMNEHSDTQNELSKLRMVQEYLREKLGQ